MKTTNIPPKFLDCEKCGTKTVHDFFLDTDGTSGKFYTWICYQCKNHKLVGKFEPN